MHDNDRLPVAWNIGRAGRAWAGEEARQRWELTPEKFEMEDGKLFWDEDQRLSQSVNTSADQGDPVPLWTGGTAVGR